MKVRAMLNLNQAFPVPQRRLRSLRLQVILPAGVMRVEMGTQAIRLGHPHSVCQVTGYQLEFKNRNRCHAN